MGNCQVRRAPAPTQLALQVAGERRQPAMRSNPLQASPLQASALQASALQASPLQASPLQAKAVAKAAPVRSSSPPGSDWVDLDDAASEASWEAVCFDAAAPGPKKGPSRGQ